MSRSRQKRTHRRARKARVRERVHPSFTGELFDVWRRARELWLQFFDRHETSIEHLAAREYVWRAEHRRMCDWVHHLEALVRCLILTAALAIKVALTTLAPRSRKPARRRAIIWDNKPSTWVRLRFSVFPRAATPDRYHRGKPEVQSRFARTLPIARRLETLRRILVAPEASARRAAFHLARIAAANRRSNQPRQVVMDDIAHPRTRAVSRGWQAIQSGLEKLMHVCEDRVDAWNRGPEPG